MASRLPLRATESGFELTSVVDFPELASSPFFAAVGSYVTGGVNLGGDHAERLTAAAVTPGFFDALSATPLHGRLFVEDDLRVPGPLAVISHRSWQRRFAGDPAIIGRGILLNGRVYDVVGVLPAALDSPTPRMSGFRGRPTRSSPTASRRQRSSRVSRRRSAQRRPVTKRSG